MFNKVKHLCINLQKERDLELAARIGQSLLKQNQELTTRNEMLDEQLEIAKEEVDTNLMIHTCVSHSHTEIHQLCLCYQCAAHTVC